MFDMKQNEVLWIYNYVNDLFNMNGLKKKLIYRN